MDRFAWSMAFRHLRYNLGQTALTMGIVSVSVVLIVMLMTFSQGMQNRILTTITESMSHVTIRLPERQPIPLWSLPKKYRKGALYIGKTIKNPQVKRKIEDWAAWLPRLEKFDPAIRAVSPAVESQAILYRGAQPHAVSVLGVMPRRHDNVIAIHSKLLQGSYYHMTTGQIVIGAKLAKELSVSLGDRLRLVAANNAASSFTVRGIFHSGARNLDGRTVFISLRDAQSLFGFGNAVSSISIKLTDPYDANRIMDNLGSWLPYEISSWMRDNQNFLTMMRSQSMTFVMIILLTTIAAGFGIASILIMSVMSKLKELGILKAMGATRSQIVKMFTIQGTLVAFLGSLLGMAGGVGLLRLLAMFQIRDATGKMTSLFAMEVQMSTFVVAGSVAMLVGFLSALYPAWRAARINPIDVIRGI